MSLPETLAEPINALRDEVKRASFATVREFEINSRALVDELRSCARRDPDLLTALNGVLGCCTHLADEISVARFMETRTNL